MANDERPLVVYVDDEAINVRVFEANFRSRFNLLTTTSPSGALEIVTARAAEIAVLLTDQRMPEMTGSELLERVRELAPDTHRMVITAYSDVQLVIDAVNRGQISRYFVKPWVKEDLAAALEDAVRIFELQVKLRRIEARLMGSERLAAIGQISAGIAHELMNPVSYVTQNVRSLRSDLATVSAYLKQVMEQRPDPQVSEIVEGWPQLIDDLEAGTEHIKEVALSVRSQASGRDVEESSNIVEVSALAAKLSRAELRYRTRLTLKGQPLQVRIGPVQLSQVLINLFINASHAIESTGKPGLIEVEWGSQDEALAFIQVRDNGAGIPPKNLERVWEPLFTTKAPGVGTGLGLSICREIIRSHGGDITLTSEVDVGTTVRIVLPKETGSVP